MSITGLRSYQPFLVDHLGLRINLISFGQNMAFPVQGDAQNSPSCCCCCFLLCFSSHQADCSQPRVVKGFGVGVKLRLSLCLITQIDCSRSGLNRSVSAVSQNILRLLECKLLQYFRIIMCALSRMYFTLHQIKMSVRERG